VTCTANEVTLAMGASVPTMKAGPVALEVEMFDSAPFEQPETRITAADSIRIASLKGVFVLGDISDNSLSAGFPHLMKNKR
jgi:hypothetical protein